MTTESTVRQANLFDMICPCCNHRLATEPSDGAVCPRCVGEVFIQPAPTGFQRLITQLQRGLLDQEWPSYLNREQCLRIVGLFQFGTDALERELRLGARHDTEATLMADAARGHGEPSCHHGQFG